MQTKVQARKLKGFNDFFAEDMKVREFVIGIFKKTFEKYGYEPLATPALELTEMMLGQSGEEAEKQFYRFEDPGGRDVMLKYEVMTSMARAVAENINSIPMPYKRYQIQRVWRAENTQKGRYREFTQCDADTIGSSSMVSDAEYIQMGLEITGKLGFKDFYARISNRKFLNGLTEYLGISDDKFYGFCMSLDKLKKIGRDAVIDEMIERRGIEKATAEKSLDIVDPAKYEGKSFEQILDEVEKYVGTTKIGKESLDELRQIVAYLKDAGVDEKLYRFDPSLARGLASYTGPVWEFEVVDGGVGSIAGCGRYDKLLSKFLDRDIPATGGSFGIERICDIIKDRGMLKLGKTSVDVLVTLFSAELLPQSLKIAESLREKDIATMLYPDAGDLKKQLKYANAKGIKWVLVAGPDEIAKNEVQVKNMETGEQKSVKISEVGEAIRK